MKLIYISNNRMPIDLAHGLQVVQMCDAFAKSGCQVELLVPRRVNPIKEDAFSYYKIEKTFSIKKIPCLDLIFLNGKNIFFWIQTITFLFFCKIFLAFKKYDILYTREQMVGLFWKNFVLEIHSMPKKIRPFHKKVWKKARLLVVLTPFIKEKLVACGVSAKKILVAPDGVDLQKFDIEISKEEAQLKLNLPENKKLVGYVGMLKTLGMEKGIDVAIKAISLTNQPDVFLVLVGGRENDIAVYKNMASKLGVADKIIFVGKVSHDVVPIYLKAFDILVAPFPENDHYSFYMSPMKIFEYMASRRPIVSTDLPSLRDIIGQGEALLVAPGSAEELAAGLRKVLNDENMAINMAEKAFVSVQKFTWARRADKILKHNEEKN